MKKLVFPLLLLFVVTTLNAQKLLFSFNTNPQLTWFSGNDDGYQANGSNLGANIGIEADFFFAERYAFSTGLTINRIKGGIIYNENQSFNQGDTTRILPADSRITHDLQYLSIPLGLKFKTVEIGYSTYWLNTGITPMVLIKERSTDESDAFQKTNLYDSFNLLNLNYFIEGGIEYSLGGSTALVAGLGYYSGFTDITKSSSDNINTKGFSLILGIVF